jgi:hypothetical protein
MRRIWHQFVDSLGDVLRLLRQGRRKFAPVGVSCGDPVELPDWNRCESLLASVLVPTDEYAYLKCRLRNGRRYFDEGEICATAYEVALALRRACKLRCLYG